MERDLLRDLSFQEDTVAQLVVDANQTLSLANYQARQLFGITARDIGRPFQDLEVSYKPLELRSLINQIVIDRRPVLVPEIAFTASQSHPRWFDVHLMPLMSSAGRPIAVKISFLEVTRVRELAEELQQSKSDLETAYEELQSSNEELETTNEELQSTATNEELETMNEELQSTNEELEALNDELLERGNQLNQANSFLESVLTSLRAAVVVLDGDFAIRAWNSRAEDLWGLRQDEVLGTHFAVLDIGLPVEGIVTHVKDVMSGRDPEYEGTFDATNRRGRPIVCRVTVNRLQDGRLGIEGVVILMEETPVERAPGS
jgi:two-component system CheB/CheR fusion protein